ncbi:hypothetical protein JCM3775_002120 [Rhodotorula graminis]
MDKAPRKRQRRPPGPDRLQQLPLELLHLILSRLDLASLLSVTLVSRALRAYVLSPACAVLWLVAVEGEALPELDAALRPVELASLVVGRHCRICGKSNARKVDYHIRARLCVPCWNEQIIYEGPDEPDPAFESFFPGTKRYTPRGRTGRSWKRHKAFFLLQTLESTSDYLSTLLSPQYDAYHAALEVDPLAELDDFVTFASLPNSSQDALDARGEWVRRCWRDGDKLANWADARRKRINAEKRDERLKKQRALEDEKGDDEGGQG